jgi:hypothetical protein
VRLYLSHHEFPLAAAHAFRVARPSDDDIEIAVSDGTRRCADLSEDEPLQARDNQCICG